MSVGTREYEESQIKVFVRLRPMRNEATRRSTRVIDKGVAIHFKDKINQLYFDNVFDEDAKQEKVFHETCKPILEHVLEGCNGALFVYGQTGTGKTYTMGTLQTIKREDQGLIPLSLRYMFQSVSEKQDWTISLSFMQIYMQDIYDLLNPATGKLQIREDLETGQTYVQKLTVVPISNYKQSIELLNQGLEYRKTGPQKMNQLSSRSHTIVSIHVIQKVNSTQYLTSNFSLIDLAGSERVKKSNSTGTRLEEAKFINSSLSALGNVIAGLAENDSDKYIPYRTSKLTRILKNSLSGRSRVAVICTLETSEDNVHETYSTLLFADRCKEIRFMNQPVINIEDFEEMGLEKTNKEEMERLRLKQREYVETIKSLKEGNNRGETQRQLQLSQMVEMIYRIFGEMNSHLRKLVNGEGSILEQEKPKPVQGTPIKQIKETVKSLAQQTIDQINALSSMAVGGKGFKNNVESETLCSLVLELVRSNLKNYDLELQLKEQRKEPLEKEFLIKEYQKELKEGVINKLKSKKLRVVQSFEEIWAENDLVDQNPLQSLLNNLRKGQLNPMETVKQDTSSAQKQTPGANNPKDILKRITKQESERKQKLLNERRDQPPEKEQEAQPPADSDKKEETLQSSPVIKYFQKSGSMSKQRSQAAMSEVGNSNTEIKKLLDNLMAQKNQHEERRGNF